MNRGIIEFVEPNDAGVYKRESFDITKDETDELLKLIEKSASEIIALSFWNEACPKKECEYCRLRKYIN
jgi:hypothetical protein